MLENILNSAVGLKKSEVRSGAVKSAVRSCIVMSYVKSYNEKRATEHSLRKS
jgi:hypothetical protein